MLCDKERNREYRPDRPRFNADLSDCVNSKPCSVQVQNELDVSRLVECYNI